MQHALIVYSKRMSSFLERIKALEEEQFPELLHAEDSMRMKSNRYSWDYRPSHHVRTGLITENDIELLSKPGKRLLSVGAHPGYLERLLPELGVPAEHILIADNDPLLLEGEYPFEKLSFDMLSTWPDMGAFDLIIFPESLCIALSDHIKKAEPEGEGPFATDALEASLLVSVLRQALDRLKPDGEIRSNGPQSHPNVVKAAQENLGPHELEYKRYFLRVKHAQA
jgi:hypothetical protein